MTLGPIRSAALAAVLLPVAALAHPGHDSAPAMGFFEGLLHLLSQPDHLGMIAGAVAVAFVVVKHLRAQSAKRR